MLNQIHKRNKVVYYIIRFFINIACTMPIWVVYYQKIVTPAQISLLIGTQYLIQTLFEIPSGAFADLLGRKRTVSIGIFLGSLALFLFPYATTFFHLLILVSMMGLMESFISGAEEALLYDSLKQDGIEINFKKVFSKAYVLLQSALLTGAIFGGFLYSINYKLPYIIEGAGAIIALMASFFYIEPDIDSEKFSFKSYRKQFALGIKEVFKNEMITSISIYFILVGGITWASQIYFNTAFLSLLVSDNSLRGIIQGLIRLINILLIQFVFSKLVFKDNLPRFLFFPILMMIAYIPGMFVMGLFGVPFVFLATLASTLRWIFMSETMNANFDSKYRATAISTMSMIISFVNILIYFLSGLIIPRFGIGVMYTSLGVITVLTLIPATFAVIQRSSR